MLKTNKELSYLRVWVLNKLALGEISRPNPSHT